MLKFKVNNYITLKLEANKTNIYIKEEKFRQCRYLLLNISYDEIASLNDISSVDEAAETLSRQMEFRERNKTIIPPEVEFWGHCSNLQIWVENNYNTRLLLSNLAFPLLKKLAEVGDPIAQRVFKNEIIERFLSYELNTIQFLIEEGYFRYFDGKEIEIIVDELSVGIEKMPIKKAIRYLDIIARAGIDDRLLARSIKNLCDRLYILSRSEILSLLDIDLVYNSRASNFYRLLLEDFRISKIFFESITSNQYDLQNKTIHFLSYIAKVGIYYLIKWFPFGVRKFNALNFKSALFELSIHKASLDPHLEMIEFITYQIFLWKKHDLSNYNRLMEILDGIKYLYKMCLPQDFIEMPTDEFFSRFDEYYKNCIANYSFSVNDTINNFKIQTGDNYYYDLLQERLPINDFFRGDHDAYRELREILFPEETFLIFSITGGLEDLPFGISVGLLNLSEKAKKWIKKIKLSLAHLKLEKFHRILMKELQQFLVEDFSYEEKLKVLYCVLDYIIYERYQIEIRYIDSHIFNERVKDYYEKLSCSVVFEGSTECDINYTVYPEGQQFYYKANRVDNNKNTQILQLFKKIFFPNENLEILTVFKLKAYVFYIKK